MSRCDIMALVAVCLYCLAISSDGSRVLLGLTLVNRESKVSGIDFFQGMIRRDLQLTVTTDGAMGLIADTWLDSLRVRCCVSQDAEFVSECSHGKLGGAQLRGGATTNQGDSAPVGRGADQAGVFGAGPLERPLGQASVFGPRGEIACVKNGNSQECGESPWTFTGNSRLARVHSIR